MDVERGFEPEYVTIKGKKKTLAELKKAAKARRQPSTSRPTRPRGRGDRLARGRPDQRQRVPVHRVLFHEITKDAVHAAMEQPRRDRRAEGGRPAGPPRARPAGGLQGEPDPLEDGQERPLRRPGADRRAPALVEREREIRAFKPQEYWTIEALCEQGRPDVRGLARTRSTATSRSSTTRPTRRAVVGRECAPAAVRRHRGQAARAPEEAPARAVHHQHAAAGSRQEARLLGQAHHARGAGSLRGHRPRRGGRGRASSPTCAPTRPRGGQRGRRRRASSSASSYGKEYLPDAAQRLQRPEGRRVQDAHEAIRPTDVAPPAGAGAAYPRARPVPALPAHLAALRGVADDAGGLRHDHRSTSISASTCSAPRARSWCSTASSRCTARDARRRKGKHAGGPAADSAARAGRARWRCRRSRRRSTSPSRRRASPRRAW